MAIEHNPLPLQNFHPGHHWNLALFPDVGSSIAPAWDTLWWVESGISGIVVIAIFGLMLYFSIRYRAGSKASRAGKLTEHQQDLVEIAWTIPTFLVFLAFFFWGSKLFIKMYTMPKQPGITINVQAKQWMWKFEHPNGVREINELHIPVGEDIKLHLASVDVIHDLFIPAFRTKKDVVPGHVTFEWFKAIKPGKYHIFCGQYCGLYHSHMRGAVFVMEPTAYQAWLKRQSNSMSYATSQASRGQAIFVAKGCAGCHFGHGAVRAPSLVGIYGRPVPLAGGGFAVANDAYIRDSILFPRRQIVKSYMPIMPSFKGKITNGEIQAITAYIKSLTPQGRPPPKGIPQP
jgi:cytochrome c oxidase subunit 2